MTSWGSIIVTLELPLLSSALNIHRSVPGSVVTLLSPRGGCGNRQIYIHIKCRINSFPTHTFGRILLVLFWENRMFRMNGNQRRWRVWVLMCLFKGIEREAIYHIWHVGLRWVCFIKYKKYGESKKKQNYFVCIWQYCFERLLGLTVSFLWGCSWATFF